MWGLIDTSSHDWGSTTCSSAWRSGARCCVAFFAWEARTAEPMLPLGFFRSLRFSAANAVMLALGFALLGTIYFLTLFMQNVQGYSAIDTGVRSLPLTTMIVVVAPLSGRFSGRFGPRLFVVAGLLLCALAIFGLSLLDARSPYSAIWPWLVVFGVGSALAMPVLAATVVADVDEAKAGVASGVLNTARQLGTALGVAVLGSIGATVARNNWTSFAAGLPAAIEARAQALAPLVVLGQGSSIGTLAGQLLGPRQPRSPAVAPWTRSATACSRRSSRGPPSAWRRRASPSWASHPGTGTGPAAWLPVLHTPSPRPDPRRVQGVGPSRRHWSGRLTDPSPRNRFRAVMAWKRGRRWWPPPGTGRPTPPGRRGRPSCRRWRWTPRRRTVR